MATKLLRTAQTIRLAAMLMSATVLAGGCAGHDKEHNTTSVLAGGYSVPNKEWNTVKVAGGSEGCRVVIYSPPYGKNARQPDLVTVLWDGQNLFEGRLPTRTSGPDGMPMELLDIRCKAGDHVLEVKSVAEDLRQAISLQDQETRYFRIFGVRDGKEILILDLGNYPRLL